MKKIITLLCLLPTIASAEEIIPNTMIIAKYGVSFTKPKDEVSNKDTDFRAGLELRRTASFVILSSEFNAQKLSLQDKNVNGYDIGLNGGFCLGSTIKLCGQAGFGYNFFSNDVSFATSKYSVDLLIQPIDNGFVTGFQAGRRMNLNQTIPSWNKVDVASYIGYKF